MTASLAVLALMTAACGSSHGQQSKGASATDPTASLTLEFDAYPENQSAENTMFRLWTARFEKQFPNETVSFQTYSSASQENKVLLSSLATHQGPTVFEVGSTFGPVAAATNGFHVFSQSDWKAVGGKTQFTNEALKMSGSSPASDVAVPEKFEPYAMFYNTAMFRAAGISRPPTTWAQFVTDAEKLTNPGKNQWGTVADFADPYDPWRTVWEMARQRGGDFVTANDKTATLNSAAVRQSLEFWVDWVTKYHIASPADLTYKKSDAAAAFDQGHVAMLPLGAAEFLPQLLKSKVAHDFALAPLPTIPYGMSALPPGGVPITSSIAGQYLTIPKYVTGTSLTAALNWIRFEEEPQQQLDLWTYLGSLPASQPAYTSYSNVFSKSPLNTFVQAAQTSYATPFVGSWGALEVAFATATESIAGDIASGHYTAGDSVSALQNANTTFQQALQEQVKI